MPEAQPSAVEQAAEAHAQHIVAGDTAAIRRDCAPHMLQEPDDLYVQLQAASFKRYAVLGHAKIGLHHVLKIRYFGSTIMTLHQRFGEVDGTWLVLESECI